MYYDLDKDTREINGCIPEMDDMMMSLSPTKWTREGIRKAIMDYVGLEIAAGEIGGWDLPEDMTFNDEGYFGYPGVMEIEIDTRDYVGQVDLVRELDVS